MASSLGSPRSIAGAAALATVALGLTAAPTALAAMKVVKPLRVYSSDKLLGVSSGVSSKDEAVVVVTLDSSTAASSLSVVARSRNAAGSFGPAEELTRSPGASGSGFRGPIAFAPNGDTMVSLFAGSSQGMYSFRKRGGKFSAPIPIADLIGKPCFDPAGMFDNTSRFTLVCPVQTNTTPPKNTLGHVTISNPLGPLSPPVTGFEASPGSSEPDFGAAAGPDGTRLIAWSTETGPKTTSIRAILDTGLGVFRPLEAVGSIVAAPNFPTGRFNDAAVLGDGSFVVSWEVIGAPLPSPSHVVKMRVRSPGDTGTFGPEETIGSSADGASIQADGKSGAALIGWPRAPLSDSDPWSFRLASRPKGGPIGPEVKLPGSDLLKSDGFVDGSSFSVGPDGTAQVTLCDTASVRTWVRKRGAATPTSFSGPFTVGTGATSGGTFVVSCAASVDRHGNVFVTWGTDSAGIKHALVGGLDSGAKPTLKLSSAPTKVLARSRTSFVASAGDPSGISSVKWDFGDRSRAANGSSVKHSWRRPGTYKVKVRATDRAGFSTLRSFRVKVVRG